MIPARCRARKMIEFFDVPPAEDEAFLAAWTSAAAPGATLHRALREDIQPRFAALDPGGPDGGVLLLVAFDGEPAPGRRCSTPGARARASSTPTWPARSPSSTGRAR